MVSADYYIGGSYNEKKCILKFTMLDSGLRICTLFLSNWSGISSLNSNFYFLYIPSKIVNRSHS